TFVRLTIASHAAASLTLMSRETSIVAAVCGSAWFGNLHSLPLFPREFPFGLAPPLRLHPSRTRTDAEPGEPEPRHHPSHAYVLRYRQTADFTKSKLTESETQDSACGLRRVTVSPPLRRQFDPELGSPVFE